MYRYDLSHNDIGLSQQSFIARLVECGNQSIAPDDLTEEQGKHLASWLKGLYDSGNEGLSNDVFASCRPQDFYLIVPTFFSQTIMACSAGVLSHETVKSGLECKLYYQPPALLYTNHLYRSWGDVLTPVTYWGLELDGKSCTQANA